MNGKFVGERLEVARDFHGLTQRALALEVSASAGIISQYETGQKQPTDDLADALAEALKVRADFFYQPLDDVWLDEECSFRHRRTTQEKVKKRARAHGTLVGVVIDYLAQPLRFPPYDVPHVTGTTPEEIEAAAGECRKHWKLGLDTPILNMGRVIERAGIVMVQHLEHSEKIDAFSRRGRKSSVVVLNTARQSTSRWIFDLAHELGHFALHKGMKTGSEETEAAADYFAGAFLLPRRAIIREFGRSLSWDKIWDLKRRWMVSAAAIVRRSYQLGLIGAIDYRRANKYLSARFHGREPYEPEFTGPELLPTAFRTLQDKGGITVPTVCAALSMTPQIFHAVTGVPADPKRSEIRDKILGFSKVRA